MEFIQHLFITLVSFWYSLTLDFTTYWDRFVPLVKHAADAGAVYLYSFLAIISIICILDNKINTDNLLKSFGFLLMSVGALTKLSGKDTIIVWIGLFIVIVAFMNDLWYWTQHKDDLPKDITHG